MQPQATGLGNVDPSTRANMFGVGVDAGHTNIQFITADASAAPTKTDSGANLPGKTAGATYEFRCFCEPNASDYSLERLDSAQFTEGSANTELPVNTTQLGPMVWINNGAVNSAAQLGMMVMYMELPY